MTADTTKPSYWLNWRFLICAIWILAAMVVSALIIWKYEGSSSQSRSERREENRCNSSWCTHTLLLYTVDIHLGHNLLWGSSLSVYGCFQARKGVGSHGDDTERGTYTAPIPENASVLTESNGLNCREEPHVREAAGPWSFAFQIIFQMTAGAVVLTDCVFWLLIYPFLTDRNYRLHFLAVCVHSVNAVCLLGDVFLNCLRFPLFRIAYFVLWTCVFVCFQWILHIFVSLRWPYPFLDLSSKYAPIWYFAVGVFCLPCYGIFALIIRMKKCCLSRFFHSSIGV